MARKYDEDEFSRLKMGRFSEADVYARLVRPWPGPSSGGSGFIYSGISSRVAMASDDLRPQKGAPQTVIKAAGTRKTIGGILSTLSYLEKERGEETQGSVLKDGFGRDLTLGQAKEELDDWDLLDDEDNYSPMARKLAELGNQRALQDLDEKERHHYVQAHHLIFSALVEEDEEKRKAFDRAVTITIDHLFTENGFETLWTVHDDCKGRLHAHVLLNAKSRFGQRARFDRHGLVFDGMKKVFAESLTAAGLPHESSRREDRLDLRQHILSGNEPFRPGQTMVQVKQGLGHPSIRVPDWWELYGDHSEDQRIAPWGSGKRTEYLARVHSQLSPKWNDLVWLVQDVYADPVAALARWCALRAWDNDKVKYPHMGLADWFLLNRPEVFGAIAKDATKLSENSDVKALIRHIKMDQPVLLINVGRRNGERRGGDKGKELTKARRDMVSSITYLAALWEHLSPSNTQSQRMLDQLGRDFEMANQATHQLEDSQKPLGWFIGKLWAKKGRQTDDFSYQPSPINKPVSQEKIRSKKNRNAVSPKKNSGRMRGRSQGKGIERS